MAEQYWIGGFYIDLSRNQITQNKQSQTIAPKALAVLTYLAENQGKVVSHDALLAHVWQDTVVSPNTLQRSIAQLRKALGDDGKVQIHIKTHAKQGYSLECNVRWHDNASSLNTESASLKQNVINESRIDEANSDIDDEVKDKTKPSKSHLVFFAIIFGIMMLTLIGYQYLAPQQPLKLSFGELHLLTSSDNKEHSGIYSPDGDYIVFNRYSEEFCNSSNIWAKNTKTQKETQLTKNMGRYDSHSFSKDGKKLVFIKTENCEQPINQKDCYKLMTLDFDKALAAPQSPRLLMECKNSRIAKATWINNNNIVLLQEISNRWVLTSYSIAENKSKPIYSLENGNFFDYDYSVTDDLIALTSIHSDGQNYIEILTSDGQLLSSHQIEYPPEITNLRYIYPNFTPFDNQLIFSTGRQLFTLSYQGKITNISLPLDQPMGSPVFHPDGKRALTIKGNWDSDIATLSLSQIAKLQSNNTQAEQSHIRENNNSSISTPVTYAPVILERSTLEEDNAIYQPYGDLIAFKSYRSGEDQVWITDGHDTQQLSQFPIDSNISGMDWATDGQSILVNVNNTLTQLALDSSQKIFTFDHRVEKLFQWDSEGNTALLIARIEGLLTFGEFNLNNAAFNVITDKKINWAFKSEDGRVIYTDKMDRYWQPGPAEDQLIEALNNQGSDKQFIIKDNVVYGINEEFQLWSYDLNQNAFETLGNLPKNVDNLTDMNQMNILLTLRINAKKEVAELYVRE